MILKQGESVTLYLLYVDAYLEEIFTNKVQAEAYTRDLKDMYKNNRSEYTSYNITERRTAPHDNNM